MRNIITEKLLERYKIYLADNEKSLATTSKYIRDVRKFIEYVKGQNITKELVTEYKRISAYQ